MAKASNRFALWLTIGRIFSMLVLFAMPMVMTRLLSQSDYGVFSQFFTLYLTLNVIFALGFHANLYYYYPTAEEEGKDEYVSNTLLFLLLMSLLSALALSFPPIRGLILGNGRLGDYAPLVVLCIALTIPNNIVSPLVTVREDKWGAVFIPGVFSAIRLGVMIVVAILSRDLRYVFLALVCYQALVSVCIIVYAFHHHSIRFNWDKAKRQIAYSIPFGLIVAIQQLVFCFDKLVGIRLMDEVQYAIYSVAFLSIPGINQIYESLCQVNIVNMTRSHQAGELQEVRDEYMDFVIKTLSFSTPVILAVALFAEEVIGFLFPGDYLEAARYFRVYSLTFLVAMFGAGTVLRAIGKVEYALGAYLISAAVGLPLTFILTKQYGPSGAIIGAAVNLILPRVIQMFIEAKCLDQSIRTYLPWRGLLVIFAAAILLLVPMYLIKHWLNPGLIGCILAAVIYVLALYGFYLRKGVFILERAELVPYLRILSRQDKEN